MGNLLKAEQEIAKVVELFPAITQAQKDYYDEAIKSGFTEDQAVYMTGVFLKSLLGR